MLPKSPGSVRSRQKKPPRSQTGNIFLQNPVGVHWRKGISSPLSSVCIPGGACCPPLHRAFCSSCMHQGHTGEHSKLLCMPVPAGSLFCTAVVSKQVNNQQSCSQGQGCLLLHSYFHKPGHFQVQELLPRQLVHTPKLLCCYRWSCLCWTGKALSELQLQVDNLRAHIFLRWHINPRPRAPSA